MKGEAKSSTKAKTRKQMPATTPEARENQMIALAVDNAEQALRNGTASPSIIIHYLKLGSTKEKLEKEKLIEENKLLRAKTEAISSEAETKEMYLKAINAFKKYSGGGDDDITDL